MTASKLGDKALGLWPLFAERLEKLIEQCAMDAMVVGVHSGHRSIMSQDELYALGRTVKNPDGATKDKPMGNIVTWAKGGDSWHNHGVAADVVFLVDGKWSWKDSHKWEHMGFLGKHLGLTWGGDWKPPKTDRPHFQMTGGLSLAEAKAIGNVSKIWKEISKRLGIDEVA